MKRFLSWSSGKDAAFALFKLQNEGVEVEELSVNISQNYQRVSMHGLRKELLLQQLKQVNIPVEIIELPSFPNAAQYELTMGKHYHDLYDKGFRLAVYGDIFLEDIKNFRQSLLSKYGLKASFPLWGMKSETIVNELLDNGFKSIIISADAKKVPQEFVGETLSRELIKDLPEGIDPCGENGEFHTFCYDAPIFENKVEFKKGELITKCLTSPLKTSNPDELEMPFHYLDLLPKEGVTKSKEINA